jgi:hypothetical protein
MTKADRMMELLRARGLTGANAAELSVAGDCAPKQVVTLLKPMIEQGVVDTVVGVGRRLVYRCSPRHPGDASVPSARTPASWIPQGLMGLGDAEVERIEKQAYQRGYAQALADMRAWAAKAVAAQ